jgi:hypothetical protein
MGPRRPTMACHHDFSFDPEISSAPLVVYTVDQIVGIVPGGKKSSSPTPIRGNTLVLASTLDEHGMYVTTSVVTLPYLP